MRFFAKSPSIPDALLNARDEGRVVFFCGAGVSRAYAGLSDFFGLAKAVVDSLGVSPERTVRKLLSELESIHQRIGIDGLISADQVFGLLERDFLSSDIEKAVAQALKPSEMVNLSAHKILLDLAKTPEGKTRLVTTNFDRLFEDCDCSLKVWRPPRLPTPSQHAEMDGIIHLHGCVDINYTGAEGDGFILSSSEFGHAYLADGWATTFIRQILNRYVVVFVGYTADDPPVRYLLEALNKQSINLDKVYAFQFGIEKEASAKWNHKGVEAISYSDANGHEALWKTLEAWAERARDPAEWYKTVLEMARQGPEQLQAHERGQVAHIVSNLEGMRKFASDDVLPPAEWLCVFDPQQRFEKPGRLWEGRQQGHFMDPFDIFGLDSDQVPQPIDPEDHYVNREIPLNAWDCFAISPNDQKSLREQNFPAFRGRWAGSVPRLPARLQQLGVWIAKQAHQPASVWWAARNLGLHPDVQKQIQVELNRSSQKCSPFVRKAWSYLFEVYKEEREEFSDDWYHLRDSIRTEGWNLSVVRKYATINCPFLRVKKDYFRRLKPPESKSDIRLTDLIDLEVAYPEDGRNASIPDEWLELLIREFRKGLETALILETELGSYSGLGNYKLRRISPILSDNDPAVDSYARTHGLSGYVIFFSSLFERLVQYDPVAARKEFAAWPVEDVTIFSRLRIWASGFDQLLSVKEFGLVIASFNDKVFWDSHHQRDLLLVLAKRWCELKKSIQKRIETRLLRGRKQLEGEEDSDFVKYRSLETLNRISWMNEKGCEFTFDFDKTIQNLQKKVPDWKPNYARKATSSMEPRGGVVTTDTNYSSLMNLPPSDILAKAKEIGGRTDDFLIEKDPFAGLCDGKPILAFRALTHTAKGNEFPVWAWETFLQQKVKEKDRPKFFALIAKRISTFPNEAVKEFHYAVSDWLLDRGKELSSLFPEVFDKLVSKLIEILRVNPSLDDSGIRRGNRERDWAMEALNTPAGKIAQTFMKDHRLGKVKEADGFPPIWLSHVNILLSLGEDLRRHALVIFSFNLNWFFERDPNWTRENILSFLGGTNPEDRDAVWSGILWGARIPTPNLYEEITPYLIEATKEQGLDEKYLENLAGILLAGWGTLKRDSQKRYISNDEMRNILVEAGEKFRSSILWNLESWARENYEWASRCDELLKNVWPRQISVRSSKLSASLLNLAIQAPERFLARVEIILPLLTTINNGHFWISRLDDSQGFIIDVYPEKVLTLLDTVLPEDVAAWPFNIEGVLSRISEIDPSLRTDERLLELNRKWNAR